MTSSISVSGVALVATSVPTGSSLPTIITYTVSDSAGNKATAKRRVYVRGHLAAIPACIIPACYCLHHACLLLPACHCVQQLLSGRYCLLLPSAATACYCPHAASYPSLPELPAAAALLPLLPATTICRYCLLLPACCFLSVIA